MFAYSSGDLELKEIMMLLHDFYGEGFMTNQNVKKLLDHLASGVKKRVDGSKLSDLTLNAREFQDFCGQYRMLLGPAFTFQRQMKAKVCGKKTTLQGTTYLKPFDNRPRFLEDV